MEDEPAYQIIITPVDGNPFQHEAVITDAIQTALRRHHAKSATISVALIDDLQMAELNKTHLNHEGPTDVLAFDLRDHVSVGGPELADAELEGEIVLSIDTALRESQVRGHSLAAELSLYAVHATLHLLGYTDKEATEAEKMHAMEDEILTAAGMGKVYRSDAE